MTQKHWTNDIEENYEKDYLDKLGGTTPRQINYFPVNSSITRENKTSSIELERVESLRYRLPKKLRHVLDLWKYSVHYKNTSAVWVVDGRSGMGKSTFAGQQGLYCDPRFSLKNYHWDPETFLEGEYNDDGSVKKIGLKNARKGDCIIFDEAMIISNRSALSKVNRMITQSMSMIRSKNIFIIFCVNSIFDLDKSLSLSRSEATLHVYGKNLYDRGNFTAFYKGIDGQNRAKTLYLRGHKIYSYSKPKANFFATFPMHSVVDDNEYNKQKDEGVARFLNGDAKNKKEKYRETFKILLKEYIENVDTTYKELSELLNISEKTITNLIREYKEENDMNTNKHLKTNLGQLS